MTVLLIVGGYLLGGLVVWRRAFCWAVDSEGEDDRLMAAIMGFLMAMLWPVTVLVVLGAKLISGPTPGERRKAREVALTEELAEVKRLAREHGLPL